VTIEENLQLLNIILFILENGMMTTLH